MNNEICINKIVQTALKAILYEVAVTPKPGLVDRNNSGAHKDMDFFTFMAGAAVLSPHLLKMSALGYEYGSSDKSLKELFKELRSIGMQAEKDMFTATANVNTHKGQIFSLGLICCSCGYNAAKYGVLDVHAICETVGHMVEDIIATDLCNLSDKKLTNGEKLYIKHGVTGVRGEALSGFKSVRDISLPVFKKMIANGADINLASLQALLFLMANVVDTNILARHDYAVLDYVQKTAAAFIEKGGVLADGAMQDLLDMDKDFIAKNISPGGCADLLCITLMLYFID